MWRIERMTTIEALNKLRVSEMKEEKRNLSDLINNNDFHTILTDDARDFDIHEWEKRIEADDDSDTENIEESARPSEHFTVSKEDVQNILNKIASSSLFVANYYKTNGFMKANGLDTDDVKEIARQLSMKDYSYSMESTNFKLGDTISVFITNKDFKVKGKNLSDLTLYIEIDVDYGDVVAIVSMHSQSKGGRGSERNPYRELKNHNNK